MAQQFQGGLRIDPEARCLFSVPEPFHDSRQIEQDRPQFGAAVGLRQPLRLGKDARRIVESTQVRQGHTS